MYVKQSHIGGVDLEELVDGHMDLWYFARRLLEKDPFG